MKNTNQICPKCLMEVESGYHIDSCDELVKLMKKLKKKSRRKAIQTICDRANMLCMHIHDVGLFEVAVRHLDIKPYEYYNDPSELSQEEINACGDNNWKAHKYIDEIGWAQCIQHKRSFNPSVGFCVDCHKKEEKNTKYLISLTFAKLDSRYKHLVEKTEPFEFVVDRRGLIVPCVKEAVILLSRQHPDAHAVSVTAYEGEHPITRDHIRLRKLPRDAASPADKRTYQIFGIGEEVVLYNEKRLRRTRTYLTGLVPDPDVELQRQELQSRIDVALEYGFKEEFMTLTYQLKELNGL